MKDTASRLIPLALVAAAAWACSSPNPEPIDPQPVATSTAAPQREPGAQGTSGNTLGPTRTERDLLGELDPEKLTNLDKTKYQKK